MCAGVATIIMSRPRRETASEVEAYVLPSEPEERMPFPQTMDELPALADACDETTPLLWS